MRKKCKRKHYELVDTIAMAIDGARITTDDKLDLLKAHEANMINSIVQCNENALYAYKELCQILGVSETMARNGIGPEVLAACKVAESALIKLKQRFEKWHKWDITDQELHAIKELFEWHHLQRTSISRGEYERFLKTAVNRMRSRAPEVIEI